MPAFDVARKFAAALDAEDYDAARALLADECVYHAPGGQWVGPAAIVDSYRHAGESARRRFDSIHYTSRVLETSPTEAVIEFFDRIHHRGQAHEYRCQQALQTDAAGRITQIRHIELPGQRGRLDAFLNSG